MRNTTHQGATEPPVAPPGIFTEAVFPRRLREVRDIAGLTQQQLADRVTADGHKMFRSTVAKIEAGNRPVSLGEAINLASALGIPLTHLIMDNSLSARRRDYEERVTRAQTRIRSLLEELTRHSELMAEQKLLYEDKLARLKETKRGLEMLIEEGKDYE